MAFFPIFIDLSDKTVVVAGGGVIAERRIRTILPFAGRLVVIANEVSDSLQRFLDQLDGSGRVVIHRRKFEMEDIDGAYMVLACTDDSELNRRIMTECRVRGILGNNASDKENCDFFFPGLIHKDPVVIGITSGGQDHRLVKKLRIRTEETVEKVFRRVERHQ